MNRRHVIIDGNNLLHFLYNDARISSLTRVSLYRELEQWSRGHRDEVTLVFDGPAPAGYDKPMPSGRIACRFSAPETADDVIVRMIHAAEHPDRLRVVSSDGAVAHEARRRRCESVSCAALAEEMFPDGGDTEEEKPVVPEKPSSDLSRAESDEWLEAFGFDTEDEDEWG